MGFGIGIFFIAVGAILAFAVHSNAAGSGIDVHAVGIILLAVGALGTFLSLLFWSSWGGTGLGGGVRRRTYVDGPGVARETRIDEY